MFEYLKKHKQIVVTGPQRSGTTICSAMIAADLGYPLILEERFSVWKLWECFRLMEAHPQCVIQAPGLCSYAHVFPDAVIFMKRNEAEIKASMQRVNWDEEKIEVRRYFKDDSEMKSTRCKWHCWASFQLNMMRGTPYTIDYDSLKEHPLWIAQEERTNFGSRQFRKDK